MGTPPFVAWAEQHPAVGLATFADAAADGELIVNATSGFGALPRTRAAGADNLAGKVVIDISNPLDFSNGFPPPFSSRTPTPSASRSNEPSPSAGGQDAQHPQRQPDGPPEGAGGQSTIFVSGDDAPAKATVTELLASFGHTDVIDLGDISTARGTEMMLPVWVRLMGAIGTPVFNFKIVR